MFNIGFGELLIIMVVLIIAVGPDRLPALMRTIGKTIRSVRQASDDLRASVGLDEIMRQDLLDSRRKTKTLTQQSPPTQPESTVLPPPVEEKSASNHSESHGEGPVENGQVGQETNAKECPPESVRDVSSGDKLDKSIATEKDKGEPA